MAKRLALLLFSLLLFSATIALAKEDPELEHCRHQCRHQQRYTERQRGECEEKCEAYYREKERREGGGSGSGSEEEFWRMPNPQSPVEKFQECQRRCESREEQHRPECHRSCVEEFERDRKEARGGGRGGDDNPGRKDPEEEYLACRAWCGVKREDLEQCQRKCQERREERERGGTNIEYESESESESRRGAGEENPYVFRDEHFSAQMSTDHGRVRFLQKFTERSEFFRGIENFRVGVLETNPQTFTIPSHLDADIVGFVANGRGTISLIFPEKRESFNIRYGDVFRIPAGTTNYIINTDNREKLVIVKLIRPVFSPGNFEAFFGSGGENPESFYRVFSTELLEAALNTKGERLQSLLGQQKQGVIVKATEEQIRQMSQEEEGGGIWPFGGESKGAYNLNEKRPSVSNQFGRLHVVDSSEFRHLRDLDVAVGLANITRGGMMGPVYNSKATMIVLVVDGDGYFEMACPHLSKDQSGSGSGRSRQHGQTTTVTPSYQKLRAPLQRGVIFVVPAGHPIAAVVTGNRNLVMVGFDVNAQNNQWFPLAGKRNVVNQLDRVAKELSFGTPARQVEEAFGSQEEELFFKGPRQQHGEEGHAYA